MDILAHIIFKNSAKGFEALLDLVCRQEISLFIVQVSGNYHLALVEALKLHGFQVAVVNPHLIKNFSRALGLRSKTDVQDARLICEYGMHMEPPVRERPDKELLKLKAKVSRRRQIVANRTMETNRLRTGSAWPASTSARSRSPAVSTRCSIIAWDSALCLGGPVTEQRLGLRIAATVRGGGVSWEVGRQRGSSIG